jgi:DNA-binding transcriptional LysR family regulator
VAVRLLRESLMVALPEDHPLATGGAQAVRAEALAEQEFIAPQFEEEAGFQEQIAEIGRHGGFAPRVVRRARDFITAASLVGAGVGVAVVPASPRCLRLSGVVYLPFADIVVSADLAAAFRRDEREKAARAFIEQIRKAAPPAGRAAAT